MKQSDEDLVKDMKIAIGSIDIEIMRIKRSSFTINEKREKIERLLKKKRKAQEVIDALKKRVGIVFKP